MKVLDLINTLFIIAKDTMELFLASRNKTRVKLLMEDPKTSYFFGELIEVQNGEGNLVLEKEHVFGLKLHGKVCAALKYLKFYQFYFIF